MKKQHLAAITLAFLCASACGDDGTSAEDNGASSTNNATTRANNSTNNTTTSTNNTQTSASNNGTTSANNASTNNASNNASNNTTGGAEADFACVGRLDVQDITQDTAMVTFMATSLTGSPLEGVSVRACSRQDRECLEPQAEGVSNALGEVVLALPVGGSGWKGYLEARGEGLRDTLAFFPNPIVEDSRRGLLLVNDVIWDAFALASGMTQDPEKGSVASIIRDCNQQGIAGAHMTVTVAVGDVETIYTDNTATPDPDATETARFGLAGAFNVPAGSVGLEASHADSGVFAEDIVFVRPGMLSQTNLEPQHRIATDWSCLGEVVERPTESDTIERTTRVVDAFTRTPLAGVTVRVCAIEDINCVNPLDEDVTDAQGLYNITMPNDSGAGFTGYTEYTGGGIQNALVYVNADNRLTNRFPTNLLLFSQSTYTQLLDIAGATVDDDRGAILANARDCTNRNAADVAFDAITADERSSVFYTRSGLPTANATATDGSGIGAITNLPAGPTTLAARRTGEGAPYTRAVVPVRAGFLTSVILVPSE